MVVLSPLIRSSFPVLRSQSEDPDSIPTLIPRTLSLLFYSSTVRTIRDINVCINTCVQAKNRFVEIPEDGEVTQVV